MKKILVSFLILLMSFSLISCGSKKDEAKEVVKQEEKSSEEKAEDKKEVQEVKSIFNVIDIADKNKEEVDKVLGKPTSTEKAKFKYSGTETYANNCSKAYYTKDKLEIEVMFIEGTASRITITHTDMKKIDSRIMLPQIGLEVKASTVKEPNSLRWENVYPLYEVSVMNDLSGGNAYTYIITNEKYK